MKRDFQEEYQNYIESDMPDLWSRIEPNLREKGGETESGEAGDGNMSLENREKQEQGKEQGTDKQKKVIYLLKRVIPVAACLCALAIGIRVIGVSKRSFIMMDRESANAPEYEEETESASEPEEDAGMAYEEEMESVDEAAEEPAAAGEGIAADESFDVTDDMDDAVSESAAPAEAPMETAGAEETAGIYGDTAEGTKTNGMAETGEAVIVEGAVLSKIAVASEEMQEEGYAYAYTFRLEDNSRLVVYLTNDQCRELEESGVEIRRQAVYKLSVFPMKTNESMGETAVGEGFLENLEKLP